MNAKAKFESRWCIPSSKIFSAVQESVLLFLLPLATWAGGIVNNCTEADLRAAMAGGGVVTFACDGTIVLNSTITNDVDTSLIGTGHQITISGKQAVRLFWVQANVAFTAINLNLVDGLSREGSAILNYGQVTLTGVNFWNNQASTVLAYDGLEFSGAGGALCNVGGTITATDCGFTNNSTYAQIDLGVARGGALFNINGQLNLFRCIFVGNQARGGSALHPQGGGTDGAGGAVCNQGTLVVRDCSFFANSAAGGSANIPEGFPGGRGGNGQGGAIFSRATLSIEQSTFSGNSAIGGAGALGYTGGTWMDVGLPGGTGGPGGSGDAGAILNLGTASLINCTVFENHGFGGGGGPGGQGGGGYVRWGGPGGTGGPGGSGFGGVDGTCNLTNCTLVSNLGSGGPGGVGGPGGHGIYGDGGPGSFGVGGTASGATTCPSLFNCLLAANSPGTDTFPDAKLGPLADNGGSTLTMALLPDSPAIDAADTSAAPFCDQRGYPRPAGSAADMGAFEYGSMLPVLSVARAEPSLVKIVVRGNSNQWCRLLTSSNLTDWILKSTNQIDGDGKFLFYQDLSPGVACRFYRVAMP